MNYLRHPFRGLEVILPPSILILGQIGVENHALRGFTSGTGILCGG